MEHNRGKKNQKSSASMTSKNQNQNPKVSMTQNNASLRPRIMQTSPGPPTSNHSYPCPIRTLQKPGSAPNKEIFQMTPLQLMLTTTQENLQQASVRQTSERTTPPKFFNPFSQLYITPPPRAKLKNSSKYPEI